MSSAGSLPLSDERYVLVYMLSGIHSQHRHSYVLQKVVDPSLQHLTKVAAIHFVFVLVLNFSTNRYQRKNQVMLTFLWTANDETCSYEILLIQTAM